MLKKLETMDAETLMTTPMEPLKFIVSGLIPQGLQILEGSPKIGKSWLSLWICLQVAKGENVWGFKTLQSEVLYLCLENSFARIQSRLFEITDEAPPTLHLFLEFNRCTFVWELLSPIAIDVLIIPHEMFLLSDFIKLQGSFTGKAILFPMKNPLK